MVLCGACGWRFAALVVAIPGAAMAMTQYRLSMYHPSKGRLRKGAPSMSALAIMITNTHMQALRWVASAGHNKCRTCQPYCRNKTE